MERNRRPRASRREAEQAARTARDLRDMMLYGGILLILVCLGLAYYAWRETTVSAGVSATPVDADLAEIERTRTPPDLHLRLGRHVALYNFSVFEYESDRDPGPFLPDGTPVNYCLYPVVSESHPALSEEGAESPDFAVLVKTERFRVVGAIPGKQDREASVEGLVINRIESLDAEEKRLIREGLPGVDLSRVLILEENRTPTSGTGSVLLFVLAGAAGVGGVVLIAMKDRVGGAAGGRPGRRGATPPSPRREPPPRSGRGRPSRRGRSPRGRRGSP